MAKAERRRTGVLISGRGSNMAALIEAARPGDYPAEIALVVSNVEEAGGLAFARKAGVETRVVGHRDFESREDHEAALTEILKGNGIEVVCLAGYMRLLTGGFVDEWAGHLINVHPSLLPAFPGLKTHERALAAGVRVHGATVHFVSVEMDSGPIIVQAAVPVLDGDTADTLAERVLTMEHRIYPKALAWVAARKVRVVSGRVAFDRQHRAREAALVSPDTSDKPG